MFSNSREKKPDPPPPLFSLFGTHVVHTCSCRLALLCFALSIYPIFSLSVLLPRRGGRGFGGGGFGGGGGRERAGIEIAWGRENAQEKRLGRSVIYSSSPPPLPPLAPRRQLFQAVNLVVALA